MIKKNYLNCIQTYLSRLNKLQSIIACHLSLRLLSLNHSKKVDSTWPSAAAASLINLDELIPFSKVLTIGLERPPRWQLERPKGSPSLQIDLGVELPVGGYLKTWQQHMQHILQSDKWLPNNRKNVTLLFLPLRTWNCWGTREAGRWHILKSYEPIFPSLLTKKIYDTPLVSAPSINIH